MNTGHCPSCGNEGPIESGCPLCPGFWYDGREQDVPANVNVGDVIEVPEFGAVGMVIEMSGLIVGAEDTRTVRLQEYPDQPVDKCNTYLLEPGDFWILEAHNGKAQ